MRILSIFLLVSFIAWSVNVNAQGCSDAGFCSIGAMGSGKQDQSNAKAKIGLNFGYGVGESTELPLFPATIVNLLTVQVSTDVSLSEKSKLGIRLPFQSSSDENDRNVSNLGDPIISFTNRLKKSDDAQWWFSVGTKIPVNDGNTEGLPMIYQTSLGTYDIILGTSLQYKKWKFALGYQQPVINNNENGNFVSLPAGTQTPVYSSSFDRKSDALVRAERIFSLKNARISAGFLAIYHLGEDEATFESTNEYSEAIEGSEGLTLNLNVKGKHFLKGNFDFTWLIGSPAVVRETRPDGLTRGFVFNAGISYKILKVNRSLPTIGTPSF